MKAEELRIGNYVTITPHSKEDVLQLNQSEMESLYIFKNWDRLQPIPLTEEWLLMFGAEKISASLYDFEIYNFGYFSLEKDGLVIVFQSQQLCEPIKYIHQLQNLIYSLTGEELTIKTK